MDRLWVHIGIAVMTTGMVACFPDVSTPEPVTSADTLEAEEYGLVRLRAESDRTTSDAHARRSMDAHFVRFAAVERSEVLRALDLWAPAVNDGCEARGYASPEDAQDVRIELLDAGRVGVTETDGSLQLEPRLIPGYVPQLSGVVYGTEQPLEDDHVQGSATTFWADGGTDIGSYVAVLDAPPEVEITAINERPIGSLSSIEIDAVDDLRVDIRTESADVYITLRSRSHLRGPVVDCRFDQAEGVLFGAGELADVFGTDGDLELIVRTAHHTALPVSAGMNGDVLYEFYDRIDISRR